uniref:L1 transposable element RRM domain-containing protein n=1 Tax=Latimeria chalumnae TaxID=7897 RepID=H3A7F6_LATCH
DLRSTVQTLQNCTNELTKQTTVLEQRMPDMEDQCKSWDEEVSLLQQNLTTALNKIDDLENRSQRNNLRILGFPEGEEKGNPMAFLRKTIPELLNLPEDIRIDIERAHGPLAPKPAPNRRPRPFIIKFLHFPIKKQIFCIARAMGNLQWQGNKISCFPNLSRELQNKQQKFTPTRNALYGLLYPSTLKISLSDQTHTFTDPNAALEFALSLPTQKSYLPPRG